MSNTIEYAYFPQDEALENNEYFKSMVRSWYSLIGSLLDNWAEGFQIQSDLEKSFLPDMLAYAQEYLPQRDPWNTVTLARWEANNMHMMQIEARQRGEQDD